ncbi:MAG TPA: LamG-like jellyroll fold domain-containing protein [Planctomycetaceae bacterium]|nr:LamG-like jellyroll fold domain-containing protein [Planctomycetaceae bacterium]
MRLILSLLICCCAAMVQAGPLDDASVLYRAAAYLPTNTVIPNEGTRTEPLVLGSAIGSDANDPVYAEDAGEKYLEFGSQSFSVANIPAVFYAGDLTFCLRYRPSGVLWNNRTLLSVIDQPELKHYFLHQSTSNKYYSRFWGDDPNRSQLAVQSTTSVSTSRIDTLVVTWDNATSTQELWLNGVKEGTATYSVGKSIVQDDGFGVPLNGVSSLSPSGHVFAVAMDNAKWTDQRIIDLGTDAVWLNQIPPPPPPPPGELRVFIDGIEVPGSLVLIDGVPVLPEGSNDKIVEVVTE